MGTVYAVILIAFGGFLSFRLLVCGDDLLKPDWLNIPLVWLAFISCAYGVYLLVPIITKAL